MAVGTPVIAYRGGGYLETVVEGKTGVFVDELSVGGVVKGVQDFEKVEKKLKKSHMIKQASSFSKERFVTEMERFVERKFEEYGSRIV
jgi:glycosyltransferase involved in cell wall biosynthesis